MLGIPPAGYPPPGYAEVASPGLEAFRAFQADPHNAALHQAVADILGVSVGEVTHGSVIAPVSDDDDMLDPPIQGGGAIPADGRTAPVDPITDHAEAIATGEGMPDAGEGMLQVPLDQPVGQPATPGLPSAEDMIEGDPASMPVIIDTAHQPSEAEAADLGRPVDTVEEVILPPGVADGDPNDAPDQ